MQFNDGSTDRDIDIATITARVQARWKMIAGCILAALVGAVIYLNLVPYRYAIEMRVAPVGGGGSDGISSKLSQLGGLAAVAGVSLPDSGGSNSFKLFVEALHSRDAAVTLASDPVILHGAFARDWSDTTKTWRVPSGLVHDAAALFKSLLGIPPRPFAPPGAARLQEWMNEQVSVDQNLKTPVVTVSMLSDDPAFAVMFLNRLAATVDDMLRRRMLLRTDDYIAYLMARLPAITLAEQRVAVAQALGEQERIKMAASSNRAYAADIFEHPAASASPISPSPAKVLVLALLIGLVTGTGAALLLRAPANSTLAAIP